MWIARLLGEHHCQVLAGYNEVELHLYSRVVQLRNKSFKDLKKFKENVVNQE
jgi:hypothetical protein